MIKYNGYLLQEESFLRINLCSFSYERWKIYVPSLDAKKQTWGLGGKIEPLLRCLLRQKARRIEEFPIECRISSEGLLVFLLRSVVGLENSRHSLYQSDATLKQITNLSPAFSRAFGSLFVFYFEFSLALKSVFLSSSSHCDCFGFGFTTLNWKALLAKWFNENSKKTLLTFAKGENGWLKLELILVCLPLQSN